MGLFNISDDHVHPYQSLDSRFVKNKASTFFFHAGSKAMSPFIMEKDVLIVDRARPVQQNNIVIASVNGEMLCRRYLENYDRVFLVADNEKYKNIKVTDEMNMVIFGVVTGIARDL